MSSQLLCKILRKNYTVEAVETAEECLRKMSEKEFSLIFMDINLGYGLSGLDVVKQIRNDHRYKELPIIATTAFAMPGDKEEFIEAGCSDYLSKPFTRDKLFSLMKEFNL